MKLYYHPGACSLADHIVLEWVGEPYEVVRLSRDDMKAPKFRALNPSGKVPLLEDGDDRLSENVAILTYLSDLHPEVRLQGDGSARSRAEVMRWLAYVNSEVHKTFEMIFSPERFMPDPADIDTLAEMARGQLRTHFERLDEQLTGRQWIAGSRSIADPYLFVVARWAERGGIRLDDLENISGFMTRMYADPAVQRVLKEEEMSESVAG